MATFARRAVPVALVGVGVMLLAGCLTVPSTRQFQSNGNRVPESIISSERDAKITLGQTPIADAIVLLSDQVGRTEITGDGPLSGSKSTTAAGMMWYRWSLDPAGRQYAIGYSLRTATDVYPLCFNAQPRTQSRLLVLTVDEHRRVTAADTFEPGSAPTWMRAPRFANPGAWLTTFDEHDRATLRAGGVIPDDALLARMQASMDKMFKAPATRPSTQASTDRTASL